MINVSRVAVPGRVQVAVHATGGLFMGDGAVQPGMLPNRRMRWILTLSLGVGALTLSLFIFRSHKAPGVIENGPITVEQPLVKIEPAKLPKSPKPVAVDALLLNDPTEKPTAIELMSRPRLAKEELTLADFLSPRIPGVQPTTQQILASTSEGAVLEEGKRFVMSLCADLQGNTWIGTEGGGIQRMDYAANQLTTFTTKDGLGDNFGYALACDRLGRIWVGHLNHGVSVYNGEKWQTYEVVGGLSRPDTLSGPLGERIFAIKVCPTDGDVWIATNAGFSRYSESKETWSYYTKADGLPSDQASALAFDPDGNIYIATQCDGIIMADAKDGYQKWRQVTGPDKEPTAMSGDGLPTNLMNDILVSRDGSSVYCATDLGLAYTRDRGKTWKFVRGNDADKINPALCEDYCTCLAETASGQLWVGHREHAPDVLLPGLTRVGTSGIKGADPYIQAILAEPQPLIGTYASGPVKPSYVVAPEAENAIVRSGVRQFPLGAQAPSTEELADLLKTANAAESLSRSSLPIVAALPDDWRTQGDWLGRYGRYAAILCAMDGGDYLWGAGRVPPTYGVALGLNHNKGDRNRYWVGALYSGDRRILELPPVYLDSRIAKGWTIPLLNRRDAQWDDHGEAYPPDTKGPNLYVTVSIPDGLHSLSLYEVNSDGRSAHNRLRDYRISVREHLRGAPMTAVDFDKMPELVRTRVATFWAGVYKRFAVEGPCELTVGIDRNGSLNTSVAAVMLDDISDIPSPYFDSGDSQSKDEHLGLHSNEQDFIIHQYLEWCNRNPLTGSEVSFTCCMVMRWMNARASTATPDLRLASLAAQCQYRLWHFTAMEASQRRMGLMPARDIEHALKWDPRIPNNSGLGRYAVGQYLNDRKNGMDHN